MQTGSEGRSSSPDLPEYDSDDDPEEVGIDGGIVVPPSHVVNERAILLEQQQNQVIFTRNSNKLLTDMLDEVYTQLQPRRPDWDARQSVIQFITKFVNHKIPGSSISAFGSFVMDLFTSSSDLDLSLNVADGRSDRSRNDKVHYLRKVAKALYGLQNGLRQSVQKIETVYRAAVPVVKFVEFKTGIECDISVENNDGVLKSRVLGMFSTMDSRFRQLCYLVKAWAKKHNVNSSKNGTLNSLSICLLVAFHLQTCSPPILPPFSVFMEGLQLSSIASSLQTVESRVREHRDRGFGRDNTETVPELFASFFLKLIAVESLWGQGLCSSTYEGRWISKIWPKNHIGCISVEDFADRTQNVARSVSRKEFELIYQVLQSTVSNLKDPVLDVLEAKDLKAYLFGSIRQRHHHKGADHHEVVASHAGRWQGGNGWSPSSGDSRRNGRGHEAQTDSNSLYSEGTAWVHKGSQPVYANRPQGGGRGPGHRANSYRKVEQRDLARELPTRVGKVTPIDVLGNGDYRGGDYRGLQSHQQQPYVQYVQYPPLGSTRSNPVQEVKQVAAYKAGYRDHQGYGKEDYPTQSTGMATHTSGYSGGGFVHRDVDFPTIDTEQRVSYPGSVAYPTAERGQVGRMTYATAGSRGRSDFSAAPSQVQVMPSGSGHHQYSSNNNQRTGGHHQNRSRRGQRNRANNQPGSEGQGHQQQNQQQQYSSRGNGFANGQWQAQTSPSNHQFLVR